MEGNVKELNPLYSKFVSRWSLMRDSYAGEEEIKNRDTVYLPPTQSMTADGLDHGQPGRQAYNAYKKRAVYWNFVSDAVEQMIGMMHGRPPIIELPEKMEFLMDDATQSGEGLASLLRGINEEQLVSGRVGIALDMPREPGFHTPYIETYPAESIINWDARIRRTSAGSGRRDLSFIVLKEVVNERKDEFKWTSTTRYRVLSIEDEGAYSQVSYDENGNMTDAVRPSFMGRQLKDVLPFVIVNSKDVSPDPDLPPLLGLANLSLVVYRGEGDYRQNLFMQGQDTLVIIGALDDNDAKTARIGAGALIKLPQGSDAKYVGVNSKGLAEQRVALENDKASALERAGRLLDSRQKESGDALHIRVASKAATLTQIALSGAAALENILKIYAEWIGEDPDEVRVSPNLDFVSEKFEAQELVSIMTAKNMGAPISRQTVHDIMLERGMTTREYMDEMSLMDDEGLTSAPLWRTSDPEEEEEDDGEEEDGKEKDK